MAGCRSFDERFHEVLDQRNDPGSDPILRSHAKKCHACAQTLTIQTGINRALTSRRHPLWRTRAAYVLATAAAILFVASLIPGRMEPTPGPISQPKTTTDDSVAKSKPRTPKDSKVLASATPNIELWSFNHLLPSELPDSEWMEPVTTPIRPLTNSMTSTLNVLRNTIPGAKPKKPRATEKTSYRFAPLSGMV